MAQEAKEGDTATLIHPYKGYKNIKLVKELQHGWIAEICGCGKEIEVQKYEFELD